MGTKITARELLFSCAAAPEMIQYYLEIGYLFGVLNRETYWCMFHRSTVPVGAGAVFLFISADRQYGSLNHCRFPR